MTEKHTEEERQTPSKLARLLNIKVTHAAEVAGISGRTLHSWYFTRPKLFRVIIVGVYFIEKIDNFIDFLKFTGEEQDG